MNNYKRIESAILYIEDHAMDQPSLLDIAHHVGLSEYHFQRLFKRWAGISPKRYIQYLTAKHCGKLLQERGSALDIAMDAGLSGPSRLHDLMVNVYAMTPEEYRSQGDSLQIQFGWHDTPFGNCLIAVTDKGVCWLSFHDDKEGLNELKHQWPASSFIENKKSTEVIVQRVFERVHNEPQKIMLHVKGTNLQIRVWEALLNVPWSEQISYSELATRVNHPSAVRAVASAVGRNPVSYIIPCHRVIRSSGGLGGYRWGLERKQVMQAWESVQTIADGP